MRVPIRIEGNARGRALRFVFGPRRRRRLTARVIPLGSLAELSALWRRVFCLVSGLTEEAASWDTQLPTPSTLLREEGMSLRSFVDPDFALRLLKEEGSLDSSSSLPSLCPPSERRRICLLGQGGVGSGCWRAKSRNSGQGFLIACINVIDWPTSASARYNPSKMYALSYLWTLGEHNVETPCSVWGDRLYPADLFHRRRMSSKPGTITSLDSGEHNHRIFKH